MKKFPLVRMHADANEFQTKFKKRNPKRISQEYPRIIKDLLIFLRISKNNDQCDK